MGMPVAVCFMIRKRMGKRAGREGEGWRQTKNRETPF